MPPLPAAKSSPVAQPGRASRLDELRSRPRVPGQASFFYFDSSFQVDAVKVLPGEYYVDTQPIQIVTVLGSCIAVCLWDAQMRVGGMNHFMLPHGDGKDTGGRYGVHAMELLINEMLKQGARRSALQAKVFGGGQVMKTFTSLNVGEKNTEFVLNFLRTERIPILSKDVLDIYPRKVCFFPDTGKAMVKKLASTHEVEIQEVERAAATKPAVPAKGGEIELF
ncbi:MAG TPA: chemoreceptor glutamine deamidase CheD [Burkholderiaceae bacterium]|nr:chemoreceptor glutamine deamidase CheD [Burkholderiaceae bacterium]